MRLVITMMTKTELLETDKVNIKKLLEQEMNVKSESFNYNEEAYFEFDVDLFDVTFTKETIYSDIDKVIRLCERELKEVRNDIEFIIANDDTSTEVERYVSDWNDIKDFGLFISHRQMPDIEPYYSSEICNAYLNFEYVSFGCIF